MDMRDTRAAGWQTFSGLVLALSGIFGVVYGLMPVYKSSFFVGNAVFVFSDLRHVGWITSASARLPSSPVSPSSPAASGRGGSASPSPVSAASGVG